uniref:Lecithin-cholesterol acyltransferase-like 1 n=1 Tax=Kalanchoe fedtschenkoi TaxID=63787 RepID=A0A7N0ZQ89_KALFE
MNPPPTAAILIAMISCVASLATGGLHPVIIVPGSGGNQLEGRLTEDYKTHSPFCRRWRKEEEENGGWFRLWFDPSVLLGPFTKCFAERMTLRYDPVLDDYRNAPGVVTRVRNFGSTESLLYLDPNLKHITTYMAPLVDSLEQIGYVDGQTLFGAPYDWRYGLAAPGHPSKVGSKFLEDLKSLIEDASHSNGGKPVILLSHSLGGLFTHQLLIRNPPVWRQKYIKHFVALSAPWGGTVQEMLTFASGYTLDVPLVNPLLVRDEQRSSESNLWLLPAPWLFDHEKMLVVTPGGSYSRNNISNFLRDIGFSQGVGPYETRILPMVRNLTAPEVNVTCVVGSGVRTAETLFYGEKGFDQQPEILYGDGDGTVNMASLAAVESWWGGVEDQSLKMIKLDGVSHTSVLKDDVAVGKVVDEIVAINSQLLGMVSI